MLDDSRIAKSPNRRRRRAPTFASAFRAVVILIFLSSNEPKNMLSAPYAGRTEIRSTDAGGRAPEGRRRDGRGSMVGQADERRKGMRDGHRRWCWPPSSPGRGSGG